MFRGDVEVETQAGSYIYMGWVGALNGWVPYMCRAWAAPPR